MSLEPIEFRVVQVTTQSAEPGMYGEGSHEWANAYSDEAGIELALPVEMAGSYAVGQRVEVIVHPPEPLREADEDAPFDFPPPPPHPPTPDTDGAPT